jgi:SPP1 gp7 family putative phage head morphogenesis protein
MDLAQRRDADRLNRTVEVLKRAGVAVATGATPSESHRRGIETTETTRATNGASRESLAAYGRESGRQMVKTWLSAQDDRVRDEHAEIDGEQRPIDEAFSNGLQSPGEPNCRCTLIYSATEAVT